MLNAALLISVALFATDLPTIQSAMESDAFFRSATEEVSAESRAILAVFRNAIVVLPKEGGVTLSRNIHWDPSDNPSIRFIHVHSNITVHGKLEADQLDEVLRAVRRGLASSNTKTEDHE